MEPKNGGGAERVFRGREDERLCRRERIWKNFEIQKPPSEATKPKGWAGREAERLKKLKEKNDKKTKKLDRCRKVRYGYKGNFQRSLFSYILEARGGMNVISLNLKEGVCLFKNLNI